MFLLWMQHCQRLSRPRRPSYRQVGHPGPAGLTSAFFHRRTEEDGPFPQRTFGNGDGFVPAGSHPGRRHGGRAGVFWGAGVDL